MQKYALFILNMTKYVITDTFPKKYIFGFPAYNP